jgi:hypothetical protein
MKARDVKIVAAHSRDSLTIVSEGTTELGQVVSMQGCVSSERLGLTVGALLLRRKRQQ